MSEQVFKVTDPYKVPVVFVNQVIGSGQVNGIVNISFATALFSVGADGKIDPDLVITSRLRLDLFCVQQLHDTLGKILAQNVKTGVPN